MSGGNPTRAQSSTICHPDARPQTGGHTGGAGGACSTGYFLPALRRAQEAVIRSDTAFFSAADIFRRFLSGLASDLLAAAAAAAFLGEEERLT